MSDPPPSNEMEKVGDTTLIEYSEKPSDVEGQDEKEGHDKVNIILDLLTEQMLIKSKDDFRQGNGARGNGFPLDWLSNSSLPLRCSTSLQYVAYLSQTRSQVLTVNSLRRHWRS